jgi:hypothetical protein
LVGVTTLTTPITTTQLKIHLPSTHPASFRFELYTECLFHASFEADIGAGVNNGLITSQLFSSLKLEVRTAVPFPNKAIGSNVNAMPAFVVRNTGAAAITLRADNGLVPTPAHTRSVSFSLLQACGRLLGNTMFSLFSL